MTTYDINCQYLSILTSFSPVGWWGANSVPLNPMAGFKDHFKAGEKVGKGREGGKKENKKTDKNWQINFWLKHERKYLLRNPKINLWLRSSVCWALTFTSVEHSVVPGMTNTRVWAVHVSTVRVGATSPELAFVDVLVTVRSCPARVEVVTRQAADHVTAVRFTTTQILAVRTPATHSTH